MADLIIDPWAGLDHKDKSKIGKLPTYLDDDQVRRLTGYRLLEAYIEGVARLVLPDNAQHTEDELQEFGDAAVLVERVAAGVLGEDPIVAVVGADVQVPDAPDLPDKPTPPDTEGVDPRIAAIEQRVFETSVARWVEQSTGLVEEWETLVEATPNLLTRQRWLLDWAEKERLIGSLQENEVENIVGLGDGVVVLGWDAKAGRVSTEIVDPDAYMPQLGGAKISEFPDVVHLVFPYTDTEGEEDVEMVRRVTYELVPIEEVDPSEYTPAAYLAPDRVQSHVLLHTDATWLAEDFETVNEPGGTPQFYEPVSVQTAEEGGEILVLNRYGHDGLDFIPVVHIPNTQSTKHHFGRSLITRLAQLLDEIHASDTDESLSSRWAARPPVVIDGLAAGTDTIDLSPGMGIKGSKADTIDMAPNLVAIGERVVALQKRLSVNSQVPDGLRGRVDASQVPSGLALTLSFTPFVQLIGRLREARSAKYPLLLKFVQRIAIQHAEESGIDSDVVHEAEIRYGAFMPQDLLGITEVTARLYMAKMISLETALVELQAAGLDIGDLSAEIAKIRATDGETALAIAEATGLDQAAIDHLGLDMKARPVEGVDDQGGNVIIPPGGLTVGAGAV